MWIAAKLVLQGREMPEQPTGHSEVLCQLTQALPTAHHVEGASGPLQEAAAADGLFQRSTIRVLEQHPRLDQLALRREAVIQHPVDRLLQRRRGHRVNAASADRCTMFSDNRCNMHKLYSLCAGSLVTVAGTGSFHSDQMNWQCTNCVHQESRSSTAAAHPPGTLTLRTTLTALACSLELAASSSVPMISSSMGSALSSVSSVPIVSPLVRGRLVPG